MKNLFFTAVLFSTGLLFTVQAETREGHALVRTVSGQATMSVDGKNWVPLKVGSVLKTGATVKTSKNGQTDLFLGLNGSMLRIASSSELTISSSKIEWSPTSCNTFSAGDELSFAYQKSASSKTWSGVSFGVAIELTDYDI